MVPVAVICWLLLASFRAAEAQSCGPCNGCGTETIDCRAATLSAFPALSATDRQQTEILYVSHNNLSSLSADDFANFTSLKELYISSNIIQTVEPETFSQLIQLTIVDFEDNELQELPQSLFTSTPNLTTVDFSDNLLNCDCGLRWLPLFLSSSQFTGTLTGACSSPTSLSGVDITDLTEDQLICDCAQECVNGLCDMSVGLCVCDDGYTGENCNSTCLPGMYGAGCLQNCSCVSENEASPCNPANGTCHCLPGFTGLFCQDHCAVGFFGQDCAEECLCQNGGLCHPVTGVCTCTAEWSGTHCNISSCSDGVRNNNETDVDCGGNLCPPCPAMPCRNSGDCEEGQVCLGQYVHPSNLLYPFSDQLIYSCVNKDFPGERILQKFKDALRGRNGAFSDVNPRANLSVVESSVQQEIEIQFGIEEPLKSVMISTLEQDRGDPLYQASIQWKMSTPEATMERNVQQIISNINSGLLKGTVLINREDRKVILNI